MGDDPTEEGSPLPTPGPTVEFPAPIPDIGTLELWKFELMREDRRFASAIRFRSLQEWSSHFAPEGSVLVPGLGEIRSPDSILASLAEAVSSRRITGVTWGPDRAEVSNSGDLGYTVGEFRISGIDAGGTHIARSGRYVSIWRRQGDGSWKAEMTLGNPTGPPEEVPDPGGVQPADRAGG